MVLLGVPNSPGPGKELLDISFSSFRSNLYNAVSPKGYKFILFIPLTVSRCLFLPLCLQW